MSTLSTTELSRLRRKRVTFAKQGVAKATDAAYYMLVQRMNASGKWKHKVPGAAGGGVAANGGIVVYGARAFATPANLADRYDVHLAVVLSLNSTTSANLAFFSPLAAEPLEANFIDLRIGGAGNGPVLNATGGALLNAYGTTQATVTGVRTALAIADPQGNTIVPAVGDIVFQVVSASSQLATPAAPADNIAYFEVSIWYDCL